MAPIIDSPEVTWRAASVVIMRIVPPPLALSTGIAACTGKMRASRREDIVDSISAADIFSNGIGPTDPWAPALTKIAKGAELLHGLRNGLLTTFRVARVALDEYRLRRDFL